MNDVAQYFSQVLFVERLRALMASTGKNGQELAKLAGITKQTFSGYLNAGRVPSIAILASWVREVGLEPTWLLTGEGPMLRSEATQTVVDPIAQRVDQLARTMRESGVDELKILAAARDVLEGEIAKLHKIRGEYGFKEPMAGLPRAAESQDGYGVDRAAGDDSV